MGNVRQFRQFTQTITLTIKPLEPVIPRFLSLHYLKMPRWKQHARALLLQESDTEPRPIARELATVAARMVPPRQPSAARRSVAQGKGSRKKAPNKVRTKDEARRAGGGEFPLAVAAARFPFPAARGGAGGSSDDEDDNEVDEGDDDDEEGGAREEEGDEDGDDDEDENDHEGDEDDDGGSDESGSAADERERNDDDDDGNDDNNGDDDDNNDDDDGEDDAGSAEGSRPRKKARIANLERKHDSKFEQTVASPIELGLQ